MAKFLVFLAVLGVSLSAPRRAEACSCPPAEVAFLPPAGATDVPLDVVPLYRGTPPLELYAGDVLVASETVRKRRFYELRPLAPLAALTEYELRDPDGAALSTFTTGETELAGAPEPASIAGFRLREAELENWGDSCIGVAATFVDLELTDLDEEAVYNLRQTDRDGQLVERWWLGSDLLRFDDGLISSCGARLLTGQAGDEVCVELARRGLDGEESAFVSRCATVEACASIPVNPTFPLTCQPPAEESPDAGPAALPGDDDGGGCRTTRDDGGWAFVLLALLALRIRRRASGRASAIPRPRATWSGAFPGERKPEVEGR